MAGNHDRCWTGHGVRADGWAEKYLDAGFERINQGSTTVDLSGHDVLLCHFPYWGDSKDHDRYVESRPADNGEWLVHGHVHDQWKENDRMINVGVDVRGFAPMAAEQVIELLQS